MRGFSLPALSPSGRTPISSLSAFGLFPPYFVSLGYRAARCSIWTLGLKPSHPAQVYNNWGDPENKKRPRNASGLYYDDGSGKASGGGGGAGASSTRSLLPVIRPMVRRPGPQKSMPMNGAEGSRTIRCQRVLTHSPLIQHYVTSRNGQDHGHSYV